jgi:hypothetical protein
MKLKITWAKLVVFLIPASCPFARDLTLFGLVFHIPPLCKYNPFYDDLMKLRFDSLEFLEQ